ncbi:MAG TPA: hypothetical protein P5559_00310 [Candidatus Limiplasma sp.]|nr:hypothetical protein [Candidatus Limiplasma sp.]
MSDQKGASSRAYQIRYVAAQQDHVAMLLKQLGADVRQINGLVCFVRFWVGKEELLYVYNLNADNRYYLQRAKPYPMSAGVFPTTDAIAEYIGNDLRAFQNAMRSGHYAEFVELNRRIVALAQGFEQAFLRYNVAGDCFAEAKTSVMKLEHVLSDMEKSANPLVMSAKEKENPEAKES